VTDATAAIAGSYLWVYGGTTADGKPTGTVQRGQFGTGTSATNVVQFGVRAGNINLPQPRTNIDGFAANGNLYAVGGSDGATPKRELYWGVPTIDGDIPEWKHLVVSDLPPEGNAGGAPMILGPNAIIVGGQTTEGVTTDSIRANIAPEAPFFQLGLFGATVPALKIDGEIGQQLGYLNANTVGIVDFAIHRDRRIVAHRTQILVARPPAPREENRAGLMAGRSPSPGSGEPVGPAQPSRIGQAPPRRRTSDQPRCIRNIVAHRAREPAWQIISSGRSRGEPRGGR
jgi:hypothetical protein